jgi:hypothetical protein
MKSSRIIAILVLLVGVIILSIPAFVKYITFEHKIEPYAPVSKAYSNIVSNYEEFYLFMKTKNIESSDRKIIEKKENQLLVTEIHHNGMKIESRIEFVDRTKKTRMLITEKIKFDSWMAHAFGVLFSSSVFEQRERYYQELEQSIESTPDSSIIPSELK